MAYRVSMTDPIRCDRLGGCIHICPTGVWQWAKVGNFTMPWPINSEKCIGCMKCVKICPPRIIEVTLVDSISQ